MKKAALWMIASAVGLSAANSAPTGAASGFRKATEHFYYLESRTGAANVGAMITAEGVLLIDPPPEPAIPAMVNALRTTTDRTVRWVVTTNYQQAQTGGVATFLKQGAAIIGSKELDRLASSIVIAYPSQTVPQIQPRPNPRFLFGQQMHLFPSGIEVRIMAVKSKARTAGDVVVFVPSEKVLQVGDFFTPGSFPVIDSVPGEGSAPGWIDGLKQVVESVPLLKPAIQQPRQEATVPQEPEKTPEEMVVVIPGHGDPSSLQEMKALLAVAQRLRAEATKAIAVGRTREEFVKSLSQEVSGGYANLEAFAGQLFDDLSKK
jgi:glyoxylase-like metal-dependent hydrolase (beta-lactamase superfamily II)